MKKFTVLLTVILFINTVKAQFTCGDPLLDVRDGQIYATVLLGEQCWMAENLNYGTYAAVTSPQASGTKFCQNLSWVNDPTCPMGGLYEWANLMQGAASCNGTGAPPNDKCSTPVQGLCPAGWHVPSHYEWTTLEKNVGSNQGAFPYDVTTTGWLGTDEGGNMKVTPICGSLPCWNTPNTGATNTSGFTALPGGGSLAGSFGNAGNFGFWWSSTEYGASYAWYRDLTYSLADVDRDYYYKDYGFSVRCVKDIDTLTSLTISPQYGSISIYPNPNDGVFNLVIESEKKDEFHIEITNINGQVIIRKGFKPLTKIIYQVDLSKYPKGVYLVKIMSNKINRTEKIILL